jgi:hypothetical protein
MGNELFGEIHEDSFHIAAAVELFHNFSLIHDDIMDEAPLRRGKPTIHAVHGEPTALLGGDVMMVAAYDYINKEIVEELIDIINDRELKYKEVKKYVNKTETEYIYKYKPEILKNKKLLDSMYEEYAVGNFVPYKFMWKIYTYSVE